MAETGRTNTGGMQETALYAPIKAFLVARGYDVKSEIGPADIVACRGDDPPVIVEMKTAFSLALFHQAIARQTITDAVYVAVPRPKLARALRDNLALARRLGLGVICVRLRDGFVEVLADPAPYRPRKSPGRRESLLREFRRRAGDPNEGGMAGVPRMTAYRQDALRCLAHLAENGPSRGADVARGTGVPNATRIMADDHYGWFERLERGIYTLTHKGTDARADHEETLSALPMPIDRA